jgi:TolA-binding protein
LRLSLKSGRSRLAAVLAIAAGGAILLASAVASANASPGTLDFSTPQSLFDLPVPPADVGVPVVRTAQSAADLMVRIQDLEGTVRNLTGQVEVLQHQLDEMRAAMQAMQQDNELRFQDLEGGAGKKSEAATSEADPVQPLEAPPPLTTDTPPADTAALPPPPTSSDGLGDSADPLLGSNQSGGGTLGTLPEGQALDLSLDGGTTLSDGDALAQFAAGRDASLRGDFAFASEQFSQFLALYPSDPQAPDAVNLLGDALIQQQRYDEAVAALYDGYKAYGSSARAPEILLNFGIALSGAGQADPACRTFFEITKRFPTQPAAFTQKLAAERQKAQCPA